MGQGVRSSRVVLHGAPLPDKPEGNVVVLCQCRAKRTTLHLIAEEARRLRQQGNWDLTGSARSGYTVVAMDRTDLWFRMYIKTEE